MALSICIYGAEAEDLPDVDGALWERLPAFQCAPPPATTACLSFPPRPFGSIHPPHFCHRSRFINVLETHSAKAVLPESSTALWLDGITDAPAHLIQLASLPVGATPLASPTLVDAEQLPGLRAKLESVLGEAASTEVERLTALEAIQPALTAALTPPAALAESELTSLAVAVLAVLGSADALRDASLSEIAAASELVSPRLLLGPVAHQYQGNTSGMRSLGRFFHTALPMTFQWPSNEAPSLRSLCPPAHCALVSLCPCLTAANPRR